jgi:hypothetical protein
MELSSKLHFPAALPQETSHEHPFQRRMSRPRACLYVMEERKKLSPFGNRTSAVQPVAHHYIDFYIINIIMKVLPMTP